MLGVVLFAVAITSEHLLTRQKTELWVYQTSGATTIGLLEHKNNHLFGIKLDTTDIRYHLRDHWIKTYRNQPHRSFPNLHQVGPNYIGKIENKYFAVISDVNAMPKTDTHYNFIVYVNNALRKAAPIKECDLNIVDGSNSYYLCKELQERYHETSITFHFTSIDGAKRIPLSLTY